MIGVLLFLAFWVRMCGVTRLATPTPLRPHVNAGCGSCWYIDGDRYSHPCGCIRRLYLPPPYRLPPARWSSPNLSRHAHATLPMLCRPIYYSSVLSCFFLSLLSTSIDLVLISVVYCYRILYPLAQHYIPLPSTRPHCTYHFPILLSPLTDHGRGIF